MMGVQNLEPLQDVSLHNQYQHIIPKSIGSIVRGFKIGVTKWFRNNTDIAVVWQRNYWEHVIRGDLELCRIRQYVQDNVDQWETDSLHDQMNEFKDHNLLESIFR
jgi:REP element-mobilizing transposase RayT